MFSSNHAFMQNIDFPLIIIYLLMFLILSIFVAWIVWLMKWLRKNNSRNQSPITNQQELKALYKEEDINFLLRNTALSQIKVHRTWPLSCEKGFTGIHIFKWLIISCKSFSLTRFSKNLAKGISKSRLNTFSSSVFFHQHATQF